MEQVNDLQTMLDQLDYPAFLAQDRKICAVNPVAKQRMAEVGMNIDDLLITGQDEYGSFADGSLYLTVSLGGTNYRCSVTKLQDQELFTIDEGSANSELQVLALAAAQLRIPVSELSLELDRLKDADSKLVSMMNQSIHRLQRIIGNMSDAAAFANAVPQKSTQEICGLLREVLEKAQALLSQAGVTMRYQLPAEPIFTLADSEMLTRAVYHLISNAGKYALSHNPIEVTLKRVNNKLYLTICDNGQGVDPSLRGTMFARYKRQPGLEDPRRGLGLGMTMIHAAAAAHGGTVLVEHPQGMGTRITLSLTVEKPKSNMVRTPLLRPDIYGGQDPALIELSDVLPHSLYAKQ